MAMPARDPCADRHRTSSILSLAKSFMITENKSLELRWENFNAFNHVNLALPNNTVDVSGAGQITSTASPMRQMQLGLHFRF